jgi:exopolysaccharide biosynthesis protein
VYTDKENIKAKPQEKLKKSVIAVLVFSIVFFISVVGYVTVVFGNIPFVVKWRNIWIETAMTTDQHKWLATWFFPDSLIKEVMDAQVDIKDISISDIDDKKNKGNKTIILIYIYVHNCFILLPYIPLSTYLLSHFRLA